MKIKRFSAKKRIFCFLMALICVASASIPYSISAFAQDKSLEELNNRYEEIEKEIQENQEKLDEVEQDIKTNEQKLNQLNKQIDSIEEQIDLLDKSIGILNGDIDDLQYDIDLTTKDINKINAQIAEIEAQMVSTENLMVETKELLLARIRENYMSGGSGSTLELLLTSGDISSFFARKELVTRVSENDNELIAELSEKLVQLNELQKESEAQKAALEGKRTELDTQMVSLTDKQDDLESNMSAQQKKKNNVTDKKDEVKYLLDDLDKDSDAYKAAIKRQEAERAALEAEIEAVIKSQGSTENDVPDEEYNNDGEMMWPVKGKTTVTAGYPSYPNGGAHWGIDICVVGASGGTRDSNGKSYSYGEPFYAAQGGEVILAYNDGNWNSGFGNYCIIDHGDGKHTLYAHAKRLFVSKGDIVQKGEKIGEIGDTGNTTGPHLHFEVRIKKSDGSVSRVNPLNYVSKP
ncbi:MAG: peptidoglycan DD-metalloendopeptidase family protein [Clostridia bacterium]|nr:peptidoglycan DD-metalloendopeptidase family protein [Clostridia bacterium]